MLLFDIERLEEKTHGVTLPVRSKGFAELPYRVTINRCKSLLITKFEP